MLLHSTVPGGTAIRGAYTGALAEQLMRGHDKDITELHIEAVHAMADTSASEQVPMIQSTLKKFLVLNWVNTSSQSSTFQRDFLQKKHS